MRVIAGTYRSRILKSLKGLALRPTSDRLRETLFNVLAPNIAGSRFVDLLIRRNLGSLGINTGVTVLAVDALRGLALLASRKQQSAPGYDCVFLDPPYAAAQDYSRVLEFLGTANLLAPGGLVVAEHRRNFDLREEAGALHRFRVLRQGDAALSFYRRPGEAGVVTGGKNNSAE